jgi:transposase
MSRQELSDFQKGQFDGAARFGHSAMEIQKLLGYARGAIHRIVTRIKITGSIENKERVSGPRKSTDRDERPLFLRSL